MKYYMTIFLVLGLILSGCSLESIGDSSEEKEKQEAILHFVNEQTKKTSELEAEAFKSLSSVSGENYTDDETLYNELVETTIPAYEKGVNEAKSIKTEVKELEKATEQVVIATETFYEALMLEKEALEKQDEELIQQSNEKMAEYKVLIEEYHSEMQTIAEKYGIDYEPTN